VLLQHQKTMTTTTMMMTTTTMMMTTTMMTMTMSFVHLLRYDVQHNDLHVLFQSVLVRKCTSMSYFDDVFLTLVLSLFFFFPFRTDLLREVFEFHYGDIPGERVVYDNM
jgi:hypothetical protein